MYIFFRAAECYWYSGKYCLSAKTDGSIMFIVFRTLQLALPFGNDLAGYAFNLQWTPASVGLMILYGGISLNTLTLGTSCCADEAFLSNLSGGIACFVIVKYSLVPLLDTEGTLIAFRTCLLRSIFGYITLLVGYI